MNIYEDEALKELINWQRKMTKEPSHSNNLTKSIQTKINSLIPEKAIILITDAIKNMVKLVFFGSGYITGHTLQKTLLEKREKLVREKLNFYRKTAAVSGAAIGAGGFLLSLADFPILLSLKMKFLFGTSTLYGFDVRSYKERLYILYIFQLAFSSQKRRIIIYKLILDWENYSKSLPEKEDSFDWRTFQQEYRDYLDVAKLLQLVPIIGAPVGAFTNYKLMNKLGDTAINCYRLRVFKF